MATLHDRYGWPACEGLWTFKVPQKAQQKRQPFIGFLAGGHHSVKLCVTILCWLKGTNYQIHDKLNFLCTGVLSTTGFLVHKMVIEYLSKYHCRETAIPISVNNLEQRSTYYIPVSLAISIARVRLALALRPYATWQWQLFSHHILLKIEGQSEDYGGHRKLNER